MEGGIRKSFGFNLLLAVALCALLFIIGFSLLGPITHHGSEVKVPNVLGRDFTEAEAMLKHLGFDLEVDSSYEPDEKPYVVLRQQPEVGAIVKDGRTLFITVNKAEPPQTSMPNLVNLSFRSAELIIKSNRLVLGDTTYRPDIAKGAVLEQLYNGKAISAGTMLPQGSRIDLVIGDGLGNTEFGVPDVIGLSYAEGQAILSGNGLHFTPVFDGDVVDTMAAIIYNQTPGPLNEVSAPNRIREGDNVDIFIKQNPSPEEMERNRNPGAPVIDGDSTGANF